MSLACISSFLPRRRMSCKTVNTLLWGWLSLVSGESAAFCIRTDSTLPLQHAGTAWALVIPRNTRTHEAPVPWQLPNQAGLLWQRSHQKLTARYRSSHLWSWNWASLHPGAVTAGAHRFHTCWCDDPWLLPLVGNLALAAGGHPAFSCQVVQCPSNAAGAQATRAAGTHPLLFSWDCSVSLPKSWPYFCSSDLTFTVSFKPWKSLDTVSVEAEMGRAVPYTSAANGQVFLRRESIYKRVR